jgi:hypothetical protein
MPKISKTDLAIKRELMQYMRSHTISFSNYYGGLCFRNTPLSVHDGYILAYITFPNEQKAVFHFRYECPRSFLNKFDIVFSRSTAVFRHKLKTSINAKQIEIREVKINDSFTAS